MDVHCGKGVMTCFRTYRYLLTYRKGGSFAAGPQSVDLLNMPSLRPAFYFFASMLLFLDFCSTCLHWRQTSIVPFPMRKAMNHASAKGVTGVSRGEKSQSCSAAWSGCHESICQIEGKQGRLNDEILIFFDEWGPTCFDSIKASAISSSRLSSSFIWGTSCWMVTLWGGMVGAKPSRHSAQVATDIGPRTASRCSLPRCQWPLWGGGENQSSKHAPFTMHQFSSAEVNQTPFPVLGLIEHAWRQVVPLKSCWVMLVSLQQSFPSEIMQDPMSLIELLWHPQPSLSLPGCSTLNPMMWLLQLQPQKPAAVAIRSLWPFHANQSLGRTLDVAAYHIDVSPYYCTHFVCAKCQDVAVPSMENPLAIHDTVATP